MCLISWIHHCGSEQYPPIVCTVPTRPPHCTHQNYRLHSPDLCNMTTRPLHYTHRASTLYKPDLFNIPTRPLTKPTRTLYTVPTGFLHCTHPTLGIATRHLHYMHQTYVIHQPDLCTTSAQELCMIPIKTLHCTHQATALYPSDPRDTHKPLHNKHLTSGLHIPDLCNIPSKPLLYSNQNSGHFPQDLGTTCILIRPLHYFPPNLSTIPHRPLHWTHQASTVYPPDLYTCTHQTSALYPQISALYPADICSIPTGPQNDTTRPLPYIY